MGVTEAVLDMRGRIDDRRIVAELGVATLPLTDPEAIPVDEGDPVAAASTNREDTADPLGASIGKDRRLHLNAKELAHVRRLGVQAALLGVQRAASMHYSQAPNRWDYIAKHCRAYQGEMPRYGDCSAFVTGVVWDATLKFGPPDFLNGLHWKAGHTGTLVKYGRKVSLNSLRLLDLVFYGNEGWRPEHVAIYVGAGRVVSFGSDPGPFLLPVRYRSDVGIWAPRRYML